MNSYNYIYSKKIGIQPGKTLREIFVASGLVLLNADQGNFIRKAVFCVKGGEVLAAQSVGNQNTSCFVEPGDPIKLADNSTAVTNPPIYFELDCGPLAGSQAAMLDLRTCLKFTTTVNIEVILFF